LKIQLGWVVVSFSRCRSALVCNVFSNAGGKALLAEQMHLNEHQKGTASLPRGSPRVQALGATLAVDDDARRSVMGALRLREERAAAGYMARLKREAARLTELKEQQEAQREQTIQ
jgi:hypothetical protein